MQNKWTRYFLTFLHEWGLFILFISLFLLTRLFLWLPVQVEGHSMDPTLADGQRVIVLKHTSIERFDIVVAKEVENGKTKQIVKRIIGMPGDTITYQNDKLTINGKEVKEEYLKEFHAAFAKDKLQKEYAYSDYFQQLAKESKDVFPCGKARFGCFSYPTAAIYEILILGRDFDLRCPYPRILHAL